MGILWTHTGAIGCIVLKVWMVLTYICGHMKLIRCGLLSVSAGPLKTRLIAVTNLAVAALHQDGCLPPAMVVV